MQAELISGSEYAVSEWRKGLHSTLFQHFEAMVNETRLFIEDRFFLAIRGLRDVIEANDTGLRDVGSLIEFEEGVLRMGIVCNDVAVIWIRDPASFWDEHPDELTILSVSFDSDEPRSLIRISNLQVVQHLDDHRFRSIIKGVFCREAELIQYFTLADRSRFDREIPLHVPIRLVSGYRCEDRVEPISLVFHPLLRESQ